MEIAGLHATFCRVFQTIPKPTLPRSGRGQTFRLGTPYDSHTRTLPDHLHMVARPAPPRLAAPLEARGRSNFASDDSDTPSPRHDTCYNSNTKHHLDSYLLLLRKPLAISPPSYIQGTLRDALYQCGDTLRAILRFVQNLSFCHPFYSPRERLARRLMGTAGVEPDLCFRIPGGAFWMPPRSLRAWGKCPQRPHSLVPGLRAGESRVFVACITPDRFPLWTPQRCKPRGNAIRVYVATIHTAGKMDLQGIEPWTSCLQAGALAN